MNLFSQKRHAIDFLFPVTVFFVFTISALTVILLAARIYQSTTDDSQRNYTSGTALSYLTEKLRQNDREDGIFLDELDGTQAVVLLQETDDASYLTYLYAWVRLSFCLRTVFSEREEVPRENSRINRMNKNRENHSFFPDFRCGVI